MKSRELKYEIPPPKISSKILFKTLVKYLLNHIAQTPFLTDEFPRFSLQKQNTLTGFHRLVRAMGDSLYYVNGCQQMAFTHRNITK